MILAEDALRFHQLVIDGLRLLPQPMQLLLQLLNLIFILLFILRILEHLRLLAFDP